VGEAFDIEVRVRSNAPMRVTFDYASGPGMHVVGPRVTIIEPSFTYVAVEAIHISAQVESVKPGATEVDVLVTGTVEGLTPMTGHLGVAYIVGGRPQAPDFGAILGALASTRLGMAAAIAAASIFALTALAPLHDHRATVRRRAAHHLREVMAARREKRDTGEPRRPPR
jgi:hypothetical protein